ncbi:SUZ domain-containing protein [Mycena sanguinolenta]|uniref:SUZ domain-containing protein n=1 Tax=Mycena sanguinolenta TaxID=230812 RepID=A0A8H7CXH0_9AGAR|nr:SUZ domain-containing protein [Mycena sanguinolenta]
MSTPRLLLRPVSACAPAAALQPAMRILKRPSLSASPTSTPVPEGGGKTAAEALKEREARYGAARERIFGLEETSPASESKEKEGRERKGMTRNPRGPAKERGFWCAEVESSEDGGARVSRRGVRDTCLFLGCAL